MTKPEPINRQLAAFRVLASRIDAAAIKPEFDRALRSMVGTKAKAASKKVKTGKERNASKAGKPIE